MRVIKYGPGYEPEIIICSECKSELEYTKQDVEISVCRDYEYEPRVISHYVICPVCGLPVDVKEKEYA